jgi:hypothetical protein
LLAGKGSESDKLLNTLAVRAQNFYFVFIGSEETFTTTVAFDKRALQRTFPFFVYTLSVI